MKHAIESALEGYVDTGNDFCLMRGGAKLEGKIVVRCNPDEKLAEALSEVLGCNWNVSACRYDTNAKGDVQCLWLGPDERHVYCERDNVSALCLSMEKVAAASNKTISCVDVSSQFEAIVLSGEKVREVLSAVISLDVNDEAFPNSAVAGTFCLRVRVLLQRQGNEFYIFARRSEMHYLWRTFAVLIQAEHY